MNTVRELFKKTLAILILIALLMVKFLLAGQGLISYAIDAMRTSNENVEILAYFLNDAGEKVTEIEKEIDKVLTLKVDVTVKDENGYGGYFDGDVIVGEANFKLKDDSEMKVHVNAGETKTVEKEIEYLAAKTFYDGYLNKETSITVRGKYTNSQGEYDTEGTTGVTVKWLSEETAKAEMNAAVLTNYIYDSTTRTLQVLAQSKLANNSYPVRNTHIELGIPYDAVVEKVNKRTSTNVTNGIVSNPDYENRILKIDLENSTDTIVVTYKLAADTHITEQIVEGTSKLTLYDGKELTAMTQVRVTDEMDGSISSKIVEKEEEIYKGKLYTGEERDYSSATKVYIDNKDVIEKVDIEEKKSVYLKENEAEENANISFVNSIISKSEFDSLFGQEGYIVIKNQEDNIVANINKDTEADENGNIKVQYGDGVTNIKVTTSKPTNEGILSIINNKKIEENKTRTTIDNLKKLKEQIEVNSKKENAEIILKDTQSDVKIAIENNTISTLSEETQKLRMAIKLDTSDESKELFKEPSLHIVLPKEITSIEVEQSKALYTNGLTPKIANTEKTNEGNCIIDLSFEGEQETYDTNGGTEIHLYLNVATNKLTPTKTSQILVDYTNDFKNVSKQISADIKFESLNGLMVYKEANNTSIIEDEKINIRLEMEKAATEIPTRTVLINNYEKVLNNVTITGEVKDNTFGITLNEITNSKNAKVYYSTDGENWTENANGAKQYKITIEELNIAEEVQIVSKYGIEANLGYNQLANIIEKVTYTYNEVEETKTKTIELKTEEKITGDTDDTPEDDSGETTNTESGLTTKIVAISGNSEIHDGDNIYEGQTIRYKVTITNNTGKDLENVNVKATQTNGKVWDYVVITGYNVTYGEEQNDHYYQLTDNTERNIGTIDIIKKGQSTSFEYEAVPQGTGKTYGTINIKTEDETISEQIKTLENNIESAEVEVLIQDYKPREVLWYEESTGAYTCFINNKTNNKLNDVIVKMSFSSNLSVNGDMDYFDVKNEVDENRITFLSTEKNSDGETIITMKISALEANEKFLLETSARINKKIVEEKTEKTEFFMQAIVNSKTYSSNLFIREFYKAGNDLEAKIRIEPENTIIKKDETFTIITDITNKEDKNTLIQFVDGIDFGMTVEKVTLIKNGTETDMTSYIADDIIYFTNEIDSNSSIQVKIDAKIDTSYISDKTLKHTQTITDLEYYKTINLGIDIETDKVITPEPTPTPTEPDTPTPTQPDTPTPTQPDSPTPTPSGTPTPTGEDKPGDKDKPSDQNPDTTKYDYTIGGTVWIDNNKNGAREANESRVGNLAVNVINVETGKMLNKTIKTNKDGTYSVGLDKGKYIIVFMYDNSKYYVTTYQANKVSENINSDAVTRKIKVDNEIKTIAATDELVLDKNLTNIDLGLVEMNKFDLKLEKFVKQVIVSNAAETKTYNQDVSETLAKVEIPSKNLNGTNVVIKYTFRITNVGEVEGYASKIVDYLPSTLEFNSKLNPDWYKSGEKIYNESLANTIIKPGETKEITLTVTKKMTKSNTGLVDNRAEIEQSKNAYGLQDQTADNASADVLIGIRTGSVGMILMISLLIASTIAGAAYLVFKNILIKKIKI